MNYSEVRKYQTCYQDHAYRMGKRRLQRMKKDIDTIPAGATLLDVGCGRGETVYYALEQKILASGIDIVPELSGVYVETASIAKIPFETVDYVTCYDMLEHLPPEEVDQGLDELFRVAKKTLFLTVSGNEAEKDGETLHLSVHDDEWWHQQFAKRSKPTTRLENTIYGTERDWHWRIDL